MNFETKIITISEEALSQEVNGETVILDLNSESYFGLDEVGTRIWQLLQEKKNLQAVFDTLLDEYDVEAEQLESDINRLIDDMMKNGLLQIADEMSG